MAGRLKNLLYGLILSTLVFGIQKSATAQSRPYSGTWNQTFQNARNDFDKNLNKKLNEHKQNLGKAEELQRFYFQLDTKDFDRYHYEESFDQSQRLIRKAYQSAANQTWKDIRKNRWEEESNQTKKEFAQKEFHGTNYFGAEKIKFRISPSLGHLKPDFKFKMEFYNPKILGIQFNDSNLTARRKEFEFNLTKSLEDEVSLNLGSTVNGQTKVHASIGYSPNVNSALSLGITYEIGRRNSNQESTLKKIYEDQKSGTFYNINLTQKF